MVAKSSRLRNTDSGALLAVRRMMIVKEALMPSLWTYTSIVCLAQS